MGQACAGGRRRVMKAEEGWTAVEMEGEVVVVLSLVF
jgi:hypothetical protein